MNATTSTLNASSTYIGHVCSKTLFFMSTSRNAKVTPIADNKHLSTADSKHTISTSLWAVFVINMITLSMLTVSYWVDSRGLRRDALVLFVSQVISFQLLDFVQGKVKTARHAYHHIGTILVCLSGAVWFHCYEVQNPFPPAMQVSAMIALCHSLQGMTRLAYTYGCQYEQNKPATAMKLIQLSKMAFVFDHGGTAIACAYGVLFYPYLEKAILFSLLFSTIPQQVKFFHHLEGIHARISKLSQAK